MSDKTIETSDQPPRLAASYARKSTPDDVGLASQHVTNRQRARRDGFVIPESRAFLFQDDDTSGISTRRAGLDRLLTAVTSGEAKFARVYVKDMTRLGRWSDPRYQFFLQVFFEQHGVEIIFSDREHYVDYRADGAAHEATAAFLREALDGVVASEERARLIKRITGGMRYRVMRGFYPGARPPYGLERWLVDERTGELIERVPEGDRIRRQGCTYTVRFKEGRSRDIVREIYARIERGESLASIARELSRRGVPTPSGRKTWRGETVRRIARNPIYCGDLVWGRTTRDGEPAPADQAELDGERAILVRDFVPDPVISRERWEDVQAILDGNRQEWRRRRATSPSYLLSGLVRCAGCGAGWWGHTSTKRERRRRRYYRHGPVPEGGDCPGRNRYIRASVLEDHVLEVVTGVLEDGRIEQLVSEAVQERLHVTASEDHGQAIAQTEAEIRRYERALDRATERQLLAETAAEADAYRQKIRLYGRRLEGLREHLQDLHAERDRLEAMVEQRAGLAGQAQDLLALLRAADADDRAEVIAEIVRRVEVAPDASSATIVVRAP